MEISEYQIHVNFFNKCEHLAYFLSCKCGLCSQLKSFKSFKVFYPRTMGKHTARMARSFIIF